MRDWLTVGIVLLIIGIILDGIRRVRAAREERIMMDRDLTEPDALEPVMGSEFPSGGARIAGYRHPEDIATVRHTLKSRLAAQKQTLGMPKGDDPSARVVPPAKREVPVLMDAHPVAPVSVPFVVGQHDQEPVVGALRLDEIEDDRPVVQWPPLNARSGYADSDLLESDSLLKNNNLLESNNLLERNNLPGGKTDALLESESPPATQNTKRPSSAASANTQAANTQAANTPAKVATPAAAKPGLAADAESVKPVPASPTAPASKPAVAAKAASAPQASAVESTSLNPEEVIVINVMAQPGYVFYGDELLDAFAEQGLRFGFMDIFHRHKNEDGTGEALFSVANIVKPGIFDVGAMDQFSTPGISFFLMLPLKSDSLAAFSLMARTAKALALTLGGEIKDENRSAMTQQTFEHCRQRVVEFERKRRLARQPASV